MIALNAAQRAILWDALTMLESMLDKDQERDYGALLRHLRELARAGYLHVDDHDGPCDCEATR